MEAKEIALAKSYQRDFQKRFGKRLEIDWELMNGIPKGGLRDVTSVQEVLIDCVNKHKADMQVIMSKEYRLNNKKNIKERNALIEYSRLIVRSNLDKNEAARIINRHRSILYTYAKAEM